MTALRGNLNSVDLANVFQMLSINQSEGTLYIHSPEGRKAMHFGPDGVSVLARGPSQQDALGRILIRQDWLTPGQLQAALQRQEEGSGRLLGQVLVEQGACTREQVEDALRIQIEEEIYALFLTEGAQFEFDAGDPPAELLDQPDIKSVTFNVNSLIMEAAQRIDEWEWVRTVVPSARVIFRYSGKNVSLDDPIFQDARAGKVLASVDGRRNIDEIIEESFVSRFDVCKITALLVEAGALETVPVAELREAAGEALAAGDTDAATKFLSQVIEGHGDTPDTHRQLAEVLESEREFARSAFHYRVCAEVRVDNGDAKSAFEIYERIHEFLPTDLSAADRMIEIYAMNPDGRESRAPEMIRLGTELAEIYTDLARPSRAIQVLHRVVSLKPDDEALRQRLIDVYMATGMTGEAIAEYEAIAETALATGNDKHAEAVFRKVLSIDRGRDDINGRLNRILLKRTRAKRSKRRALLVILLIVLGVTASAGAWHFWTIYSTKRTQQSVQATSQLAKVGEQYAATFDELRGEVAKLAARLGDPPALLELRQQRSGEWTELVTRANQAAQAYLSVAEEFPGTEAGEHALTEAEALRSHLEGVKGLEADAEELLTARAKQLLMDAERLDRETTPTPALLEAFEAARAYAEHCPAFIATERGQRLMDWEKDLRHNLAAFESAKETVEDLMAGGDADGAFQRAMTYLSNYPPMDLAAQVGIPVNVTTLPAGAKVLINGEERGFTNGWVLISPRADSKIELKRSGYETFEIQRDAITEPNPRELRKLIDREITATLQKSVAFQSAPIGAELTSVTVIGNRVIVGTRGDKQEMIRVPGGQFEWALRTPNPGGVVARPAVSGSVVAIPGVDGVVYFFDVDSRDPLGSVKVEGQIWSDPVLASGRLVVADLSGRVTGIDMASREVAWRYPADGAAPVGAGFRASLVAVADHVFAATVDGEVHVIDARSGRRTERIDLDPKDDAGAVQGIAVTSSQIIAVTDRGNLVRAERGTGRDLGRVSLSIAPRGGPLLQGETVFVVGRSGRVRAISLATGAVQASRDLGADVRASAAILNGLVVIGDAAGRLTALQCAGNQIEQVWQYSVPSRTGAAIGIVTTPVLHGDRIVFGAADRRVHAISR